MTRRVFLWLCISFLFTVALTWVFTKLKVTQLLFPMPAAAEEAMVFLLFLNICIWMGFWLWRCIKKTKQGQHVFSRNIEMAVSGGAILCLSAYVMKAAGMTDYLQEITSEYSPEISYSEYENVSSMETWLQAAILLVVIISSFVLLMITIKIVYEKINKN